MNRDYKDYWDLIVALAAARVRDGGESDEVARYVVEVADAIVRRLREVGPKIE